MNQILIVDNNEHITRMFSEVLSREGYNIILAESGKEAMELIDSHKFEIAFVDLELDDTSGLNILCYLKNHSPETVATVITGKSDINYAIESIKTGVFRFLKKPFDIEDILEITHQSAREYEIRSGKKSQPMPAFKIKQFSRLLCDLSLLLPALLIGFIIQQQVYHHQEIPLLWGSREVIYMMASFAFCYSFIFTSSFGQALRANKTEWPEIFKSYSSAYVMFAAILYFVTDFIYGRMVLLAGFTLGIPALWLSRTILLGYVSQFLLIQREGPKTITIKTIPEPDESKEKAFAAGERAKVVKSADRANRIETGAKTGTSKIKQASELSNDWGSRLIKEFQANRLKKSETEHRRKPEKVKR